MAHRATASILFLACAFAAPAWADVTDDAPLPPPRHIEVPATVPVVHQERLAIDSARVVGPDGRFIETPVDAWLAGDGPCAPPCAAPCAKPCAPCCEPVRNDAPCSVCRLGYDACGRPKWSFEIGLAFWLSGLDGEVGARGVKTDIDLSLGDAIDAISEVDFAFTGGVRANYGRWMFKAAMYYMKLTDDVGISEDDALEVSFEQWIVEAMAGFRVAEWSLGCSPCAPCMALTPYVGARYVSLGLEIERGELDFNKTQSWVDPIVGAELQFDFRNRWGARVAADVGGFGIASDFTWSARAEVSYKFSSHVGAFLGFAVLDWDYTNGNFEWDVTQYGPYMGISFFF